MSQCKPVVFISRCAIFSRGVGRRTRRWFLRSVAARFEPGELRDDEGAAPTTRSEDRQLQFGERLRNNRGRLRGQVLMVCDCRNIESVGFIFSIVILI